jgi:ABC-2 type transport system ATP-binding protein
MIELNGVSKYFGTFPAVINLDLSIREGELFCFLGPNGAGKTTLLETIQGYLQPATGRVAVFGVDPAKQTHEIAARWGVMPQSSGLPMGLTVRESVRLFRDLYGSPASVSNVIEMTDLSKLADRRWRSLSGGEQQRLSLAIALCGGSDLLMLDEPTAAVDTEGRDRILGLIRQLGDAGSTILMSTHRFEDVDAVAARVVMLDRGKVVADAAIDQLTSDREHVRFRAAPDLDVSSLSQALGATTETAPGVYRVDAAAGPNSVATLAGWLAEQGIDATSIESGKASLEERYRAIIGNHQ